MKQFNSILLSALISLSAPIHGAEAVYTWIDDNGTTHFSEAPPVETGVDTQLIEVLPASGAGPGKATDDSFYSVIRQAERMQTRRLENEKLAAEKKLADAEADKARAEAQAALEDSYDNEPVIYYPAYPYYYPRHRQHHPRHGKRVEHFRHPEQRRPGKPRTSLGKTPGMPHF